MREGAGVRKREIALKSLRRQLLMLLRMTSLQAQPQRDVWRREWLSTEREKGEKVFKSYFNTGFIPTTEKLYLLSVLHGLNPLPASFSANVLQWLWGKHGLFLCIYLQIS